MNDERKDDPPLSSSKQVSETEKQAGETPQSQQQTAGSSKMSAAEHEQLGRAVETLTSKLLARLNLAPDVVGALRTVASSFLAATSIKTKHERKAVRSAEEVAQSESAHEAAQESNDGRPQAPAESFAAPAAEVAREPIGVESAIDKLFTGAGTDESDDVDYSRWTSSTTDEQDLPQIAERCRMKAEGTRWAAKRKHLLDSGADFDDEVKPGDNDVIGRAKQIPNCYLWMNRPPGPSEETLDHYETAAECFDTLADAVGMTVRMLAQDDVDRDTFAHGLTLTAESQSALRAAVDRITGPNDHDQQMVYNWLRNTAETQGVFIKRYMRAADPADPDGWEDLRNRVRKFEAELDRSAQREKLRTKRFGTLRYHAGQIESDSEVDHEYDWHKVVETINELVDDGVQPSNVEIRDLLIPIVDDLPDLSEFPDLSDVPQNFQLVLREVDRYLSEDGESQQTRSNHRPPTPEVQHARELLGNKAVVLIGGDCRPQSKQALEEAFGLKELVWVATREHQPLSTFESHVARDDVAVVLLAIRWTSHSHGDVQQFCNQYDKLLVRLPAGYSPNQAAAQIMSQCGDRLAADQRASGAG